MKYWFRLRIFGTHSLFLRWKLLLVLRSFFSFFFLFQTYFRTAAWREEKEKIQTLTLTLGRKQILFIPESNFFYIASIQRLGCISNLRYFFSVVCLDCFCFLRFYSRFLIKHCRWSVFSTTFISGEIQFGSWWTGLFLSVVVVFLLYKPLVSIWLYFHKSQFTIALGDLYANFFIRKFILLVLHGQWCKFTPRRAVSAFFSNPPFRPFKGEWFSCPYWIARYTSSVMVWMTLPLFRTFYPSL